MDPKQHHILSSGQGSVLPFRRTKERTQPGLSFLRQLNALADAIDHTHQDILHDTQKDNEQGDKGQLR